MRLFRYLVGDGFAEGQEVINRGEAHGVLLVLAERLAKVESVGLWKPGNEGHKFLQTTG
jgi:hypothetical protein